MNLTSIALICKRMTANFVIATKNNIMYMYTIITLSYRVSNDISLSCTPDIANWGEFRSRILGRKFESRIWIRRSSTLT